MPEITIGLFPDVGGTKRLSGMPDHLGLFAGLTGCHLSASDGLELDLLDVIVQPENKDRIFSELTDLVWKSDAQENARLITNLLDQFQMSDTIPAKLLPHRDRISGLMEACLQSNNFFTRFDSTEAFGDEWLDKAMATYRHGSPTTARVLIEQMHRAHGMSLADTCKIRGLES